MNRTTLDRYLEFEEEGQSARIPAGFIEGMRELPEIASESLPPPMLTVVSLVHKFAAGLADLQEQLDETGQIMAPYPHYLHEGFDLAAALNFASKDKYPVSLAALLVQAERPLYEWCPEYAQSGPPEFVDAQLLMDGQVTPSCMALGARAQSDPEKPLFEKLLETCNAVGPSKEDEFYRAWRRVVVEKPFVWSRAELLDANPLFLIHSRLVSELIDTFYVPVPVSAVRDQVVRLCPITRTRAFRSKGKWCSEFRDPRGNRTLETRGPEERPAIEGMLELRRAARTFWTLPGRHEIELADRIIAQGFKVTLWPKLDSADLLVEAGARSKRWVIDVKDYLSPRSLARAFSGFKGFRRARRILVIPDYLANRTPQYLEIFERARKANMAGSVELMTSSQLVKELEGERV